MDAFSATSRNLARLKPPPLSQNQSDNEIFKSVTQEAKSIDDPPSKVLDEEVKEEEEEEEEEEGECGFCLFMKGGDCRETFVSWQKCMEEAEEKKEDIVEKCFKLTEALKACMEAHQDYYGPILKAEKTADEVAAREWERQKSEGDVSSSEGSEKRGDS